VFTKKYKCSKQDLEILISNDILEKINLWGIYEIY
jgi:hypothetical protein